MSRVPDQFGDPTLSRDEAYAACGPAAAVAFAASYGRNPTLREALDLAKTVGWTPEGGMNGIGNQKRLLDALGVPSRMDTNPSWDTIQADAASGNPVTISTPKHYFVADDYDSKTGQYHVGQSGTALKAGKAWMTRQEIVAAGNGLNGALFVDHPSVAAPSVAAEAGGQMAEVITPERQEELARLHGGIVGRNEKDPTRPRKTASGRDTGQTERNPDPTYELVFGDGKKLDVKGERDAEGNATGNWVPTGGDVNALATTTPTTPNTQLTWIRGADGVERGYTRSPKTGALEEAKMPDGSPAVRHPAPTKPRDPDQIAASRASAANSNSLIEDRTAKRPGELEHQSLVNEGLKRKALPEQALLIQQAQETLDEIKKRYADGSITLEDADKWAGSVHQYVDTGLRGTTPYEVYKDQKAEERQRATIAKDLINQRVSSGNALAGSMYGNTLQALTANGGVLVNPGPYNPLTAAREETDYYSGGADLSAIAQELIGALKPSAATNTSMHPDDAAWLGGSAAAPSMESPLLDFDTGSPSEPAGGGGDMLPEDEAWLASQEAA